MDTDPTTTAEPPVKAPAEPLVLTRSQMLSHIAAWEEEANKMYRQSYDCQPHQVELARYRCREHLRISDDAPLIPVDPGLPLHGLLVAFGGAWVQYVDRLTNGQVETYWRELRATQRLT